jgi:hypothetical protein
LFRSLPISNPKSGAFEIEVLFCVLKSLLIIKWKIKRLDRKRLETNNNLTMFHSCSSETKNLINLISGIWKVLFSNISLKNNNKKKETISEQKVEKINIKNFNCDLLLV